MKVGSLDLSQTLNFVDIIELQLDHTYVFIPFSDGIYTPLILS